MSEAKYFPRRLSFPKLCDILIGYLNAGADSAFVGVSDMVEKSNVTIHNISRNNNFLKSWNFVDESEQEPGKYRLTREAAEFAYAYRIDPNGERTRQMLNQFLSKDEVLTQFVERVGREKLSRDSVLIELPRVIGDLRADKVGLNAFVDMISYAFQLEETAAPVKAARQPRQQRRTARPAKRPELAAVETAIPSSGPNISINLTISPDMPPEKLKAYIKAVLEAYEEQDREEE